MSHSPLSVQKTHGEMCTGRPARAVSSCIHRSAQFSGPQIHVRLPVFLAFCAAGYGCHLPASRQSANAASLRVPCRLAPRARSCVSQTTAGLVIAFPGTDNLASFAADFDVEPFDVAGVGKVYRGFWDAFDAISLPVLAAAAGQPVTLVGHSLGAAMAIMCAAYMTVGGNPLPVANGGTNSASASDTATYNITGFASTGFLTRTGAGAYAFQSLTNGITLGNLATQAANTVLANATGTTANVTAFSMPSCSTSSSAIQWTSGTGFACKSSINASSLGGTAAASYALLASPTFTGTPSAPTAAQGTNTTQLATTAFAQTAASNPIIPSQVGSTQNANIVAPVTTTAIPLTQLR